MRSQPQPSTQQLGVVPARQQLPGRGLGSSVQPCSLSATSLPAPVDSPAHLVSLLGSFLPSQHKHLLFLATVSLGSIQTRGYPQACSQNSHRTGLVTLVCGLYGERQCPWLGQSNLQPPQRPTSQPSALKLLPQKPCGEESLGTAVTGTLASSALLRRGTRICLTHLLSRICNPNHA